MALKIIKNAKKEMREMLSSVYNYNIKLGKTKNAKELLKRIIYVMSIIDRKFFVEGGDAYYDAALPIGEGQTISQPSTVARTLMLAELKEGDEVLEVGAGSGWNAALISLLVYPGKILSIDRVAALVRQAKKNVSKLKNFLKQNLNFSTKDFFKMSGKKKYDKVIVTAGISEESEERIEKMASILLKKRGILVCPRMSGPMIIYKNMQRLERSETREEYVFVPLLPGIRE